MRAFRIDLDAVHAGQVDHQSAVADGVAGDVVPAAAHRQQQVVCAREIDGGDHVVGPAQRAIIAGFLSTIPFQTWRASS